MTEPRRYTNQRPLHMPAVGECACRPGFDAPRVGAVWECKHGNLWQSFRRAGRKMHWGRVTKRRQERLEGLA